MDILVVPNPWLSLDSMGHPCAVVPIDPFKHGTGRRWVGARLVANEVRSRETARIAGLTQIVAEAEHTHDWQFETGPVRIPISDYYLERIRHGELIAADEFAAQKAGVPFVAPATILAAAKAKAVAEFDGQLGEGTWAQLNEPPANETQGEPSAPPQTAVAKTGKRKE